MSDQLVTQSLIKAKPAVTPIASGLLQRRTGTTECDDCRKKHEGTLQRAAVNNSPVNEVPPIVDEVLSSAGQPLDAVTRAFMEPRFGHDFSGVRVHTDAKAAESARAVDALAYTVGRDVVFGISRLTIGTAAGIKLLAHELTHVVQQKNAGSSLQHKLRVAEKGDTFEQEAEAASEQVFRLKGFQSHASAGLQLSRLAVEGSAASVSWIDPTSPAGAHVADPAPRATITEPFVTGNSGFRFSNYLHARLETSDSTHVTSGDFLPNSGIYRGPSYLGIPSHAYPIRRSSAPINERGVEGVEFEQLVGARTVSPGVIGGTVGAGVGIGAGAWLGAKGGAAIGSLGGPIGAGAGAIIGAIAGGLIGWGAGSYAANRATNFPPIWTRIKLRLFANGRRHCELAQHSLFPSNNFYCDLSQVSNYIALAPEETSWGNSGWDRGNPWGISRPSITP